ncbi:Putative Rhs-family protein [Minicystis rosea]|nr:Putative Rhs-family protein [Minicystis rosea]
MGGGGAGGDGDGNGNGGDGGAGGDGNGDGKNGSGDGKGAGGCGKGSGDGGGCPNHHGGANSGKASAGDPVDVVTGAMFTSPEYDVVLRGPLPLEIMRSYSSAARDRNVGLGYGWSHSLAWEVCDRRSGVVLIADDGTETPFGKIEEQTGVVGPHGWILGRIDGGFALSRVDDTKLVFGDPIPLSGDARRHRLLAIEDASANRINLRYREDRLIEVVDCVGRAVEVVRGPDGNIESFRAAHPVTGSGKVSLTTFHYNERGELVTAIDADGASRSFTYDDENHLMTSQTMPSGLVFFYCYDRQGRCVETWGEYPGKRDLSLAEGVPELLADNETRAKGIHHVKLLFGDGDYSEVVDSVALHRYFGNRFGKCDKAVSTGGVFSRRYDDNGHLLAFSDALDATTIFERDYRGRLLRVTDPLGRTTTIHRYPGGAIREVIDAAGGITTVARTDDGLILTDPLGSVFALSYGARGQIQETVAPNGMRRKFVYDAQSNLIEVLGPGWRRTTATYDGWGRCTSIREEDGSYTTFECSLGGALLAVTVDGATTRYEYDGEGNVITIRDAGGGTTRMLYGGLGRLCETHRPDGAVVRLRYDREGRVVEVHNARGEVHSITYDVAGRRVRERTFDGRQLRYKHDAMGRLISSTNGSGARTDYERDLAGQLIRCIYPDDTEATFTYDALGEVIAAACPAGRFSFERNPVGWIVGELQEVAGEAISVTTDYDVMGNPTARRTSWGHTVSYVRSELGYCESATLDGSELVRFTRDTRGRETMRLLPSGGRIKSEFGPGGVLLRRSAHSPGMERTAAVGEPEWIGGMASGTTVDRAYQYTPTHELAAIWDSAKGITRYQYDALGRLLAVIPEHARTELFAYDANGNVTERQDPYSREYGPGGRLLRKGDTEFLWNDAGQLVERRTRGPEGVRTTRYVWWETGLLRSVERDDGALVEFAYDPWARRVSKQVSALDPDGRRHLVSRTRFVWDGTHMVHEIKRAAEPGGGEIIDERTYLFEDIRTVPLAHRDARTVGGLQNVSGWFHYLNDETGAPEMLVDVRGRVACELLRSPWGAATFAPGHATTTSLRFRGQYADEETELSYNRYRYYDPAIGRYISTDPIELEGGLNLFAYAGNCPTSSIDVEGLTNIFSVIKNGEGEVVQTGFNKGPNTGPTAGPFNTGKPCAEVDALNGLAKQMGPGTTTADVRNKFTKEGYKMETYVLPDNVTEPEKKKIAGDAMEKGKIPKSAEGVCPCGTCGAMIKGDPAKGEPSIQSQVWANNQTQPGGKMGPWKGTKTWGK